MLPCREAGVSSEGGVVAAGAVAVSPAVTPERLRGEGEKDALRGEAGKRRVEAVGPLLGAAELLVCAGVGGAEVRGCGKTPALPVEAFMVFLAERFQGKTLDLRLRSQLRAREAFKHKH